MSDFNAFAVAICNEPGHEALLDNLRQRGDRWPEALDTWRAAGHRYAVFVDLIDGDHHDFTLYPASDLDALRASVEAALGTLGGRNVYWVRAAGDAGNAAVADVVLYYADVKGRS